MKQSELDARLHVYRCFSYITFLAHPAINISIFVSLHCAVYSNSRGSVFTLYYVLFYLVETSEFSQSKAEGLHQEGQKSAQTGPDQQLQANDFAPVSKC